MLTLKEGDTSIQFCEKLHEIKKILVRRGIRHWNPHPHQHNQWRIHTDKFWTRPHPSLSRPTFLHFHAVFSKFCRIIGWRHPPLGNPRSAIDKLLRVQVADPGFPRGGGANSPGGGLPTYDFAKFSQKLNEIERIWTLGGVPRAPLDPPLGSL